MVGEEIAIKAAEKASENIVEFEGDIFREVKQGRRTVRVPVRVKVGINPLSLITAAAAGLAGVLAATVAWHGVSFPSPLGGSITLFKGLKETTFGSDLNRAYERIMVKRRIEASGGEIVDSITGLTQAEKDAALIQVIGDAECQLLNREWQAALRANRPDDAARLLDQAKMGACPWAKGR